MSRQQFRDVPADIAGTKLMGGGLNTGIGGGPRIGAGGGSGGGSSKGGSGEARGGVGRMARNIMHRQGCPWLHPHEHAGEQKQVFATGIAAMETSRNDGSGGAGEMAGGITLAVSTNGGLAVEDQAQRTAGSGPVPSTAANIRLSIC